MRFLMTFLAWVKTLGWVKSLFKPSYRVGVSEAFIVKQDGCWRIGYRDWNRTSAVVYCKQVFNCKEEAEQYLGPVMVPGGGSGLTYNTSCHSLFTCFPYVPNPTLSGMGPTVSVVFDGDVRDWRAQNE